MAIKRAKKKRLIKNPIIEAKGLIKGGKSTPEMMKIIRREEQAFERQKQRNMFF